MGQRSTGMVLESYMNLPKEGSSDLAQIKLLCCDVDGVLTDGGVYYGEDGFTFIKFDIRDGMGIKILREIGIKICFITQSESFAIAQRAKKLGVDYCYMGVEDKKSKILELVKELGISIYNVCHIADDINDLSLLEIVGVSVTVPSAVDEVKNIARYLTTRDGGNGAVRELCNSIKASHYLI